MASQQSPLYGLSAQVPQQQGQFVWVPQSQYVKPPGGNGSQRSRSETNSLVRGLKYARGPDPNREIPRGRNKYVRTDKSERYKTSDDRSDKASRGDKSSRGDRDSSHKDRNFRGDNVKKSTSEGGERKRDRPSSSRDHQAASMTVASGGDDYDDDDEDDDESSSDHDESH